MNIALITSSHLRHKYIASKIALSNNLKLIVTEQKSSKIEDVEKYNEQDKKLIQRHFEERKINEAKYFGEYGAFPKDSELIKVPYGRINSPQILEAIKSKNIDFVILFGSSIIGDDILNEFQEKVINIHLGISPYYKGSGTNFFPIVNNELECIGATIHLAINEVDAGSILTQIRPNNFIASDNIHDLGNKVILTVADNIGRVLKAYYSKSINAVRQEKYSMEKVYRIKDFTPDVLRVAINNIENGAVSKYIVSAEIKRMNRPILSQVK